MKKRVSEISPGDLVRSTFLVKTKAMAKTRDGRDYADVELMDRTGAINGKIWDDFRQYFTAFEEGDFVEVQGFAEPFKGKVQLKISSVRRLDEAEIKLEEYLPRSAREPEDMLEELKDIISRMENKDLVRLLYSFLEDEEIVARLKRAPGAKERHHTYLGGLLEHTLSVTRLALMVGEHYKPLDMDLLLTGSILHDIGKVYELSYDGPFDYTDLGSLTEHIMLGVELINSKIMGLQGFPQELAMKLKHMILSHHGHYEFHSPVLPMTLEALILHFLEDMDGKVNKVKELMQEAKETGSCWTIKDWALKRRFYLGRHED